MSSRRDVQGRKKRGQVAVRLAVEGRERLYEALDPGEYIDLFDAAADYVDPVMGVVWDGDDPDSAVPYADGYVIDVDHGRLSLSFISRLIEDQWVPLWLEIVTYGSAAGPSVRCRAEVRAGVAQVVQVLFESRDGEREVRRVDLRDFEPDAVLELLAGHTIRTDGQLSFGDSEEARAQLEAAIATLGRSRVGLAGRRVTREFLERVAEIYRAHIDEAPTKAVQSHFMVSNRTASGYVQRARAAGLLPKTTPGKKRV